MTQAERITSLEVQVMVLTSEQREANKKLDDLLALRNKGAGVFWLASVLFGTTIVGFTTLFVSLFHKG